MDENTMQVYKLAIESNERAFFEAIEETESYLPSENLKDSLNDRYTEVLKLILNNIKGK